MTFAEALIDPQASKADFYKETVEQIKSVISDESFWVTNLANASAVLYHNLQSRAIAQSKPVNWCGFYITDPNNQTHLILGPFQGKVACTRIPFGKGVCGSAAGTQKTQVVRDVHAFPGHIACDSASESEVVVPMVKDGRVLGVLDIDCASKDGFDEEDAEGLEALVNVLIEGCTW